MRKILAVLLVILFYIQSAVAGVGGNQARFSGGTASMPPLEAIGTLNTEDAKQLNFAYKAGKNNKMGKYPDGTFSVPYASAAEVIYGQDKHLRIGQTIALTALAGVGGLLLLLSKSRTHYLTIIYKDEKGLDQTVTFEVGKNAIRPLLSSLEVRTGKKIEYESGVTSPTQSKP